MPGHKSAPSAPPRLTHPRLPTHVGPARGPSPQRDACSTAPALAPHWPRPSTSGRGRDDALSQVTAVSILFLTVGLSLARPSVGRVRIQPQTAALLGAALTLSMGLVTPPAALRALETLVRPVLTIVSLMTITLVAERAGLFREIAWRVARASGGNGRKLFRNLFLTGTLTGALFTNDAAVLIYTPMVYALVERLADDTWSAANRLPFYFAVLYVANLVGPLVISNPINIIVADWFGIGFLHYAAWMALPALASVVVSYFGLRIFFRDAIPGRYRVPDEAARPRPTRFRRATAVVLGLTLAGFFTEPLTGLPTVYVAVLGAVTLLMLHRSCTGDSPLDIGRGIGWDVILFVVGIFLVASGLRAAGLTDAIGTLLLGAAEAGRTQGLLATGFTAGAASAALNNHPVAQIMAMSIADLDVGDGGRRLLAFAALVGGDLGPKMLPIGSLAALMWFRMLRDRGVEVSYGQYVRLGVPVTLAAIGAALLVLDVQARVWGM
ncbi:MAG TPA: ArsB/NhaD family transporter [Longimicrobiales bacterium]|nr:ArsB/NhaD family transporter [Longimicrobiales bacterium]